MLRLKSEDVISLMYVQNATSPSSALPKLQPLSETSSDAAMRTRVFAQEIFKGSPYGSAN